MAEVWILIRSIPYEGDDILGVYSTPDKASITSSIFSGTFSLEVVATSQTASVVLAAVAAVAILALAIGLVALSEVRK